MNANEIKERERLQRSGKFKLSIVGLIDLQGYGKDISDSGFNPLNPESEEAIKRLRDFHEVVAKHSTGDFPTLALNDSAIAYRDLNFRQSSVTFDFLIKSWDLYSEIKESDSKGARMVLAVHFRKQGRRAGIDSSRKYASRIIRKVKSGKMKAEDAIIKAANFQPPFDILPHLQANFAFAKAYVAENSGSKLGLGGSRFYVDSIIFDDNIEHWIELEEYNREIKWSACRLDLRAKFFAIRSINEIRQSNNEHPAGVRDAYQIVRCPDFYPDVSDQLSSMLK